MIFCMKGEKPLTKKKKTIRIVNPEHSNHLNHPGKKPGYCFKGSGINQETFVSVKIIIRNESVRNLRKNHSTFLLCYKNTLFSAPFFSISPRNIVYSIMYNLLLLTYPFG